MKKVKVSVDTVLSAHDQGTDDTRLTLETLFPSLFPNDTYIKACRILKKVPVPALEDRSDSDKVSSDAYDRLVICIRAKNLLPDGGIWIPKYDGTENHHVNYFKPGFGFSYSITYDWYTVTCVGARLEFRTPELAKEAAVEFKQYYIDYFTLPQIN